MIEDLSVMAAGLLIAFHDRAAHPGRGRYGCSQRTMMFIIGPPSAAIAGSG